MDHGSRGEAQGTHIVEEHIRLVGVWVKRLHGSSLFDSTDTSVPTRCAPVYQAVVEGPTVWRIHWWVAEEMAQRRRLIIQVNHQLWFQYASGRGEVRHEKFVQARYVDWSLVYGVRYCEDLVICWIGSKHRHPALLVEDEEVCLPDETEGCVIGDACLREGYVRSSFAWFPIEVIGHDRGVAVHADDICA